MTSSPTPAVLPDARARAQAILESVEWQMSNHLPAKGETGKQCYERRLVETIAEALEEATPPASDAAVPAGEVREAAERLLQAVDERNMRGRDHVPSMRNEQVARSRMARALAAAPKVASDTQAEIKRLRGLLVDPGSPPWEDARAALVAELRKSDLNGAAMQVARGEGCDIPSHVALNLIALAAAPKVASEGAGLREAAQALVDRFPTTWPDYSPCYDEVMALRAALTGGQQS